ncbi:hypothetical protein P4V54_09475 [Brevibacillus nitrificans]|uniref:hypothetical protein n=1 Tax=Brevibacillus nitrificans TaxID=651560 RepID=UPI002E1A6D4F|nr:hypothetical protein [Brevibacillus nitrificans]
MLNERKKALLTLRREVVAEIQRLKQAKADEIARLEKDLEDLKQAHEIEIHELNNQLHVVSQMRQELEEKIRSRKQE